MEYVDQFLHNRILIAGVLGWFFAQILKTVIYAVVNKKLDWNRLIGDGGMPSSHSATVTSVALAAGIEQGFGSPVFAVAFIVAMVVMHDASGVRQETGKQAKILNELMEFFNDFAKDSINAEQKLKEFVGHTPLQVFAGFCLGIIVTLIFLYL